MRIISPTDPINFDPSTFWDIQAVLPPWKWANTGHPKGGSSFYKNQFNRAYVEVGSPSQVVWKLLFAAQNGGLWAEVFELPFPKKAPNVFSADLNLHLPSNKLGRRPNLKRSTSSGLPSADRSGHLRRRHFGRPFRISSLVGGWTNPFEKC